MKVRKNLKQNIIIDAVYCRAKSGKQKTILKGWLGRKIKRKKL